MTARDAWGQVAHNLRILSAHYELVADSIDAAIDTPSREAASADGAPPPAPAARLPQRPAQESAFTECPAHRQPFKEGKFGLYCTGQSDDPDWSNDKGYCRVTPRSAGAWLRQHPKGAPAAQPQDIDDVPF